MLQENLRVLADDFDRLLQRSENGIVTFSLEHPLSPTPHGSLQPRSHNRVLVRLIL